MKFYNATPHAINIITNSVFKPEIRKNVVPDGTEPEIVQVIPSDGVLSARIATVQTEPINGIPVFTKEIQGCDPLPEGYDVYIVSALYASAYRSVHGNTDGLYTVADPVYSEDGRTILGSKGICPTF